MKQLMLVVAVSALVASCASDPSSRAGAPPKQCSDTAQNAISVFLQGIKELSIALLRAATPEGTSLYGVFGNNDERRGEEVILQMAAHPVNPKEGRSCYCSVLSMIDTTDPHIKIVVVKRTVTADEDMHDYKRTFRVRFQENGNCILNIDPVEQKWERIVG